MSKPKSKAVGVNNEDEAAAKGDDDGYV